LARLSSPFWDESEAWFGDRARLAGAFEALAAIVRLRALFTDLTGNNHDTAPPDPDMAAAMLDQARMHEG
jgi:hypothetical protein